MEDDPRPDDRLESWKDIAAYLRRDVRTVQRWEQTDGLPVHRHKRAHRPLPYAYKAELDAWWTSRSDFSPSPPPSRPRYLVASVASALVVVAIGATLWIARSRASHGLSAAPGSAEKSIAVLPFLDLTEGMKEEEFADGITEELIDRLSKIPGLRVPAPTASFYYKGKQLPVADIAKALGVAYILDGSIRKSGTRLRVAARLVRPESGYVLWSESYDRPWDDILLVQDEIAGEVTKALTSSIGAPGA
jgi:transcriptional activator of cad operon